MKPARYRVGILTVSDRAARGEYADRSGPVIAERLHRGGLWEVAEQAITPDEEEQIAEALRRWRHAGLHLVLTTGGTGFAPRDVTPEATRRVIERETPGIAEALRAESLKITAHAMLSRGIAGIAGRTLIINLPGSPKAVAESMDILLPILPHALDLLTAAPDTERQHRLV